MALADCLSRLEFDPAERAELEAALAERRAAGADERQAADAVVLERLREAIVARNRLRDEVAAALQPARPAGPGLAEPPPAFEPPDLVRADPVEAAGRAATHAEGTLQRYIDAGLLRADDPELLELARITQQAERDMRVAEAAGFCLSR